VADTNFRILKDLDENGVPQYLGTDGSPRILVGGRAPYSQIINESGVVLFGNDHPGEVVLVNESIPTQIVNNPDEAVPTQLYYFNEETQTHLPLPTDAKGQIKIAGYEEKDDMMKVKSMQSKWRAGFTGTTLNPTKWDIIQEGAGQAFSVANGQLTISSGTTPLAETIIRSKEEFTIPMRMMAHVMLSQRIANQEFYVELISSNHDPSEPNSNSAAGWMFDGISATKAKYVVNGGDQPMLVSIDSTVSTTATTGSIFEIEPTADEVWFFSRAADSTAGRAQSFVLHTQIPNSNLKYKIQIRVKNLAVAPASSTNFNSQFINASDYAELTAEITAGRGGATAGQAIATFPTGGTLSSVSTVSTVTTGYMSSKSVFQSETVANINAGATFSGVIRDGGTTNIYKTYRVRAFSNQPLRLDVRCGSSATLTTNRIQQVIDVPANEVVVIDIPICARYIGLQATNTSATNTTTVEIISGLFGV